MSRLEEGRFQVGWVSGESLEHPVVVDTEGGGGRIVSFGNAEDGNPGSQLFSDPEEAEEAAELLNQGMSPDDMNVLNPQGKKTG